MIKKSFRLMLLVAFALSSVMFVSCNKYDDDIERIDNELAALNATVTSLKAAVDGGAVISSVSNTTDGVKFTLSNGQSYTVNHGTNGTNGAAGKDGSVVTIGENGNWFIDGVDTEVSAKGIAGKSPRINEAGNWEIWNAETGAYVDTNISAVGASTYVVDMGSYYELNVMEQVDGQNVGYKKINLPKTAAITSVKAVTIKDNKIGAAAVKLNFGENLPANVWFNSKKYAKGSNLIAAGSSLSAIVNPVDADASVYSFTLMDSKGNAPYVISNVTENETEGAITKAATPNKGIWDMAVTFSPDILFSETYFADEALSDAREKAAYALVAKTANGDIASAYDVTVDENKVALGELANFTPADLEGVANKAIDLTETFGNTMDNVVAYYFTLADETAAATVGATLNGDNLVATQKGTVQVNVHYLLVDGTYAGDDYNTDPVTIDVEIAHVAAESTLAPVEWTINGSVNSSYAWNKNVVYLDITNVKPLMNPTSDGDIIYVTSKGWTWTDGTALDSKSVVVNKAVYGKGENATKFAGNEPNWIATIENGKVRRNNSNKDKATSFARSQVVKFTFNPAQAFPGEYMTTLEFRLNGETGDAVVSVPVKVVITAPATNALARVSEFFDGDNAVIYGEADGTNVVANLFDLYKSFPKSNGTDVYESAYVTFDDDNYNYYNNNGSYLTSWVSGSQITVKANGNNYGSYNKGDVYTTRAIYVTYKAFNNPHIPYVYDEFNLTVKSEIAEGTLDGSNVNAVIPNSAVGTPVEISWKDIIAKDVYGQNYNLGATYAQDDKGEWKEVAKRDSRIEPVSFTVADGDDKFIEVSDAITAKGNDGYGVFTVKRKAGVALTTDVDCTVVLKVTDKWGRVTKTNIKVTLKK